MVCSLPTVLVLCNPAPGAVLMLGSALVPVIFLIITAFPAISAAKIAAL